MPGFKDLPQVAAKADFRPIARRLNSYYPNEPVREVVRLVLAEMGGKANPYSVQDYIEELRYDELD